MHMMSHNSRKLLCAGVILTGLFAGLITRGEARYLRPEPNKNYKTTESIPTFLLRVYDEMGRERFQQTWKAFNNRNPAQQDAFLTEDLSQEELDQLGSDFENLALELSTDPNLMELYADFERNLSISSFTKMDKILAKNHLWWGRIKRFLYRKLQKLAQEIIIQESGGIVNTL